MQKEQIKNITYDHPQLSSDFGVGADHACLPEKPATGWLF